MTDGAAGARSSVPRPRVLHVAATDQRRGAEVFAADLIARTSDAVDHRMLMLRASMGATVAYPCPTQTIGGGHRGTREAWSAGRALRAETRRWRPQLVFAHGGEALRTAVGAKLGSRVPILYRRIGMAPERMHATWRRRWHQLLMRRAAKIVCLADVVRDELITRFGIAPERAVMIPNAVDPARLRDAHLDRRAARADLGFREDDGLILSIAALSWEKDPIGALDITEPLLRADARLRHVFAGEGPLRPELEAKIAALQLGDQVLVLGGRDDVGRLFAATDLVLFASDPLGMEGMPTILIEAGLCGRPVVAASVPGVSEVIVDRVTGRLIAPGDRSGIRDALKELLADPEARATLGAAARDRCDARFTIEHVAPRYLALWESLAS